MRMRKMIRAVVAVPSPIRFCFVVSLLTFVFICFVWLDHTVVSSCDSRSRHDATVHRKESSLNNDTVVSDHHHPTTTTTSIHDVKTDHTNKNKNSKNNKNHDDDDDHDYLAVLNVLDFGADPTGTILSNPAMEFVFQVAATMRMHPNNAASTTTTTTTTRMVQIIIPSGIYRLRPMQLSYSNIHLHLQDNVVLLSSSSVSAPTTTFRRAVVDDTTTVVNDDEVSYMERTYDTTTNDDDTMYQTSPQQHYHNDIDYDIETTVTTSSSSHHTEDTSNHHNDPHFLHWPITPALQTFGGGREDGRHMRYEAFFTITNVENVILSGTTSQNSSRIDGGGLTWWKLYSDRAHRHTNIPYTRPSLLEIRHSTNVQVHHIQLTQSPFWTMHLYNSTNISIHDVYIHNDVEGYDPITHRTYSSANVDGIDINSCVNVTIYNSHIQTHDDGIVIKSGLDLAGLRTNLSSHDIHIYNCTVNSPIGAGLGIGSEVSGGIYNIYFDHITIYRSMYGVRIKTFHGRGSSIRNVVLSNLHLFHNTNEQYGPTSSIMISMFGGDRPHLLKGYHWDDITTMENITFINVTMYDDPFVTPDTEHMVDPVSISVLLSHLVSTTIVPTKYQHNHDDDKDNNHPYAAASPRIRNDANGIHIVGDANLRRYWSSPFSKQPHFYNDYIRNVSFIDIHNLRTFPTTTDTTITITTVGSGSKATTTTATATNELQNFDCSNAIYISYNDYDTIPCQDQPYAMFWYDMDQLKRVIQKLFR